MLRAYFAATAPTNSSAPRFCDGIIFCEIVIDSTTGTPYLVE
jgi:hypothetical protein